jgi:hypothetical protein
MNSGMIDYRTWHIRIENLTCHLIDPYMILFFSEGLIVEDLGCPLIQSVDVATPS